MKEFLDQINKYVLWALIPINIGLYVQLNNLPEEIESSIKRAMNHECKKDTVVINKVVTADIQGVNSLLFFDGRIIEKSIKISKEYSFKPDIMPDEIYKGFLTPMQSLSGGQYLIWSKDEITASNTEIIEGWFVKAQNIVFGHKDKFLQVLYPITRKI